jgi:hypothetical protein
MRRVPVRLAVAVVTIAVCAAPGVAEPAPTSTTSTTPAADVVEPAAGDVVDVGLTLTCSPTPLRVTFPVTVPAADVVEPAAAAPDLAPGTDPPADANNPPEQEIP